MALAALAVGDETLARRLYREILAAHGERLGPWVRIKATTAEATAVSTARLAIVAAALGDPLAADMDAEITAHPPTDTVLDLERVLAASRLGEPRCRRPTRPPPSPSTGCGRCVHDHRPVSRSQLR